MIPSYVTGIGLLEDDVWYYTMPFHTIAGMGMQICLLSLGNTIVLPLVVEPPRRCGRSSTNASTWSARRPPSTSR